MPRGEELIPDTSLLLGGPADGSMLAIPGLLQVYLVAEQRPLYELLSWRDSDPFEPSFKTHTYQLDGVFKVYRHRGVY